MAYYMLLNSQSRPEKKYLPCIFNNIAAILDMLLDNRLLRLG